MDLSVFLLLQSPNMTANDKVTTPTTLPDREADDSLSTGFSRTKPNFHGKRNGNNREPKLVLSNPVSYEGNIPSVGAVLALK